MKIPMLLLLIVVTFIDFEHQIIPDRITLPGIPLALLMGATILPDPFSGIAPLGFGSSLIGVLFGGGLFYLIAVIGEAAFKSRLHRARMAVRRSLDEYFLEAGDTEH